MLSCINTFADYCICIYILVFCVASHLIPVSVVCLDFVLIELEVGFVFVLSSFFCAVKFVCGRAAADVAHTMWQHCRLQY